MLRPSENLTGESTERDTWIHAAHTNCTYILTTHPSTQNSTQSPHTAKQNALPLSLTPRSISKSAWVCQRSLTLLANGCVIPNTPWLSECTVFGEQRPTAECEASVALQQQMQRSELAVLHEEGALRRGRRMHQPGLRLFLLRRLRRRTL